MKRRGNDGGGLDHIKRRFRGNLKLRETYQDVIPEYYANKKHWNSITLNTKELTTQRDSTFN